MAAEATATQRILSERIAARKAPGIGTRPGVSRKGPQPVTAVKLPDPDDIPTNPELVRLRSHKRRTVDGRDQPGSLTRRYLTKEERAIQAALDEAGDKFDPMPKTRGECGTVRPCPYVRCTMNLYLSVNDQTGMVKIHDPSIDPHEVPPNRSCALDIVDANPDGLTLEVCGDILNITRERIRQIEVAALKKARGNVVVSLDGDIPHQAD